MSEESNSESKFEKLWVFFAVLALMVMLWLLSGWWINYYYQGDSTKRGTFGDMFGAINALFSGAAFAGVIFTVLLQRKELALQRRELEQTRKELARTAVAQEKSAQLSAYSALLGTCNQTVIHLHEVLDKRASPGLIEQYNSQVKERDYYASKVAGLVGENLTRRAE